MRKVGWFLAALAGLALGTTGVVALSQAGEKTRNPFGVADVNDPVGEDVKEYAKNVKLPGDDKDKNAEQWAAQETEGKAGSLDGEWFGRWESGNGTAKVKVIKDRVYILYTDAGATWLLECERQKDKLIGR